MQVLFPLRSSEDDGENDSSPSRDKTQKKRKQQMQKER